MNQMNISIEEPVEPVSFTPIFKMNEEQFDFLKIINNMGDKDLKIMCKEYGVKQSNKGVTNKYVKRINILHKVLFPWSRQIAQEMSTWGENQWDEAYIREKFVE
jgi:hypothetical protein